MYTHTTRLLPRTMHTESPTLRTRTVNVREPPRRVCPSRTERTALAPRLQPRHRRSASSNRLSPSPAGARPSVPLVLLGITAAAGLSDGDPAPPASHPYTAAYVQPAAHLPSPASSRVASPSRPLLS
ncbi:hypothetical protein FKP32DRAFT_649427 [Trametes sanguinea]|nr:hypothetical protein FKP32DRAFT_649427 [Trametes sanguinea]